MMKKTEEKIVGAIDCGGTKVLAAVVDVHGHVFAEKRGEFSTADKSHYFSASVELLKASCAESGTSFSALDGIGVSIPGMTDGNDLVLGSPSAGWGEFSLRPFLQEALGVETIRTWTENDVNACAIAERRFADGGDNFLWMTVSTGIGGAVVSDGRLLHGNHFCAGEIGHIKVEENVPCPCGCGGRGCLEAHASGTAIGRMARETGVGNNAAECARAAYAGNAVARDIFLRAGRYIGKALAMASTVTNPGSVYIGGGVAKSFDLLLPGIEDAFHANALRQCAEVKILPTRLGYRASLLGAAALCL